MTHRDAPRAGRTTWRRLGSGLAVALLFTCFAHGTTPATAAPDGGEPPGWVSPGDKGAHPAGLEPALHDDADAGRARPSAGAASTGGEDVTVVVEASDDDDARAAIEDAGGTVELALTDRVKGTVPAQALDDVATAEGVARVREPNPIRLHETSEGVADTQAALWHTGGFDGTGTKVAIIDGGFGGYTTKLGTELPASVETDFTRCGSPTADDHGTAVSEIVHDMAPGATLRLVCIEDDVDFASAAGTMAASGVDVVNGSFGFLFTGRNDGSGGPSTPTGAVVAMRNQGILYTASAGNSGDRHFNVNANGDPTPAIAFPDSSQSFGDFVNISDGDALEITVPGNGVAFVGMSWDSWPTTAQDFDLYVGNDFCGEVGFSEEIQDGTPGSVPVESLAFQNCSSSTRVFEVIVNRWAGGGRPRLDFFVDGDVIGIEHVTGGSLSDPATSSAAMSVGAYCEATGTIQTYSSRGPTIDGRIKPDIAGPDGTSSSVYGPQSDCFSGFTGTSASAPHVAGAAALVLDANPDLDVAELQQLLEDHAQDVAPVGDDNAYGAGRLRLGLPGDAYRPAPQAFAGMSPTRLFDSRSFAQHPAETPTARNTPLASHETVPVRVRGLAGVPSDAVAVVLNVTAVTPAQAGYFTVFPGGSLPTTSNINFAAHQTVAVHVTATVGSGNSVRIFNGAPGNVHLLVDVAGWYGPTGSLGPSTDLLTPLNAPARAMDTRAGVPLGYDETGSGRTNPVGPGGTLNVQVAGKGGVPADATAVMMNVTAIAPTAGTFVTAYPGGGAVPGASSLNASVGQTVANLVVIPVGPGGVISLRNHAGSTHFAVDVLAYYRSGAGAGYVALDPPLRQLDTRTGTGLRRGALGANGTHKLRVARYDGVPADAAAVLLGVVGVTPTAAGWLTVYPGTAALPNASNVNFAKGSTMANAVLARFGTDGTVAFNNARGSTHVISDLAGYFIDPANVQLPPP